MTKLKTKPNGTKKGKHCKTDNKQKVTYPNLRLGAFSLKKSKKGLICTHNNKIIIQTEKEYKKDDIKSIVHNPIIKLKKAQYLTKNVIVQTTNHDKVLIINIDRSTGCIRGKAI